MNTPLSVVKTFHGDGDTGQNAELRSFVERIEAVRAEMAETKEVEKEIFEELAARGYMKRPVRSLLKLRAQDPEQRAEDEALLEVYKAAVGMA